MPRYDVELRETVWVTDSPETILEDAQRLSFIPSYAELLNNLDTAAFFVVPKGQF